MPFPYTHQNGLTCCSEVKSCCESCKSKLAAEKGTGVSQRTLTRNRPSAGSSQEPTPSEYPASMHGFSADERYKATLSRSFADLRAASEALRSDTSVRVSRTRVRTLTECVAPDPYKSAASARAAERAAVLDPYVDRHYRPRGTPPDGYAIALALRAAEKEAQ